MEPDRLLLGPAELTEEQRALYDDICTGRVLEVSTLVGYYTTLAWQLRLFGIDTSEASDG